MKRIIEKTFLSAIFISFYSAVTLAHVGLDYPQGGEHFTAGDTVQISWHIVIDHGPCVWDLYFSADGGNTYTAIATGLPKTQLNYSWTVPDTSTSMGMIKVVQNNSNVMNYADSSGDFTISTIPTGITSEKNIVKSFKLYPAYPNSFNSTTIISFNLQKQSRVVINIYNITGQKVQSITDEFLSPGLHKIRWNADNLSSGIYFYEVRTKDFRRVQRLVYLK